MSNVGKKGNETLNKQKFDNKKPISWIPSHVLADIAGVSERHVRYVRAGKRGKMSINASKIKFADKYLQRELDKLIMRAKEVVKN